MKVISDETANNKYLQMYLTEEELERQETKEIIEKYKARKYKIGIFVTGKKNYPEVLKKIIEKQVELKNNVC